MRGFLFIIFFLFGFSRFLSAQVEVSGNVQQHLQAIISNLPGANTDVYKNPDDEALNAWEEIVSHILKEEYSVAQDKAQNLEYSLLAFTDTIAEEDQLYYILEKEETSGNYWGTYVFNPTSIRPRLVIQAPHPLFDSNTGKQGVYLFTKTDARAFFLNGTHRCNSNQASSCSGSTSVCGASNQAYRISDVSHNASSIFHKSTEAMKEGVGRSVFLDLHGFAKQNSDPYVILSNGTRLEPEVDYIEQMMNALKSEDNSLTFKVGHQDLDWSRLLGFTNTQGRLINGSLDPCTTNATNTTGRFIHFEQEFNKLRANTEGWDKVVQALLTVFIPEEITSNSKSFNEAVVVFPNPSKNYIQINYSAATDGLNIEIYNVNGSLINTQAITDGDKINLASYKDGFYNLIIKSKGKIVGKKKIIKN